MNNVIVYGAGVKGKECIDYMKWRHIDNFCVAIADKNYIKLNQNNRGIELLGEPIISSEDAIKYKIPIIVAIEKSEEIIRNYWEQGVCAYSVDEMYKALGEVRSDHVREYLAYVHAVKNDKYFIEAEKQDGLDVFWSADSPFLDMFKRLDLNNVIELACGWGRHVPQYYEKAECITLVDVLQENIDICKRRFGTDSKIKYYKNNGYDFKDLKSEYYTAVFSYDAMVHFEMFDIYKYLCDTYRVLRNGGMALFHHSNYYEMPEKDFIGTIHARNYMSKDLFKYLAYRSGLQVVEQSIIDWYDSKNLDCITLLYKNN